MSLRWGEGAVVDRDDPVGQGGLVGESCNDAGSRVGAKGYPSLRGVGFLVAQGLLTPSCLLGNRDSDSAAPKSHTRGINGGITCPISPLWLHCYARMGGCICDS